MDIPGVAYHPTWIGSTSQEPGRGSALQKSVLLRLYSEQKEGVGGITCSLQILAYCLFNELLN